MDYEILQLIGSGSCGMVYLAKDRRTDQRVALKEFPATRQTVQSFYRELSVLFSLDHPNVLRCLNLVYRQNRKHYLVLEYAAGGSLRDLIQRRVMDDEAEGEDTSQGDRIGAMEPLRATALVHQVASALAHVHELGIVHRDIKPENVLISQTASGEPWLKLADLAVACRLGQTQMSPDGANLGSPAYMAPEQFYDEATPASDVYGLGVIYYELLTGQRPFEGTPKALFTAHQSQPPELDKIPHEACRELVGTMMAKEPADRPRAMTILRRLESLLHEAEPSEPGEADPAPKATPIVMAVPRPVPNPSTWTGPRWRLTPRDQREVTDIRALFAADPLRSGHLYLVDATATDVYDFRLNRYHTHGFPERVLTIAEPLASPVLMNPEKAEDATQGGTLLATPFFLCRVNPLSGYPRRLLTLRNSGLALAEDVQRERFFWADRRRLCCMNFHGQTRWSVGCLNYYLPPQLGVLADGAVAVSSGPTQPTLSFYAGHGEPLGRLDLPGPACAVLNGEDPGSCLVVCLGLGQNERARLLRVNAQRRIEGEVDLGSGVYDARAHGQRISLYHRQRAVLWIDHQGVELGRMPSRGLILSDALLPAVGGYAWVEAEGRTQRLVCFDWCGSSETEHSPSPEASDADEPGEPADAPESTEFTPSTPSPRSPLDGLPL